MASRRSYFTQFNRLSPLFLCGVALLCSHSSANADEFSLVPAGSPIYSQLSSLEKLQDGSVRNSNLTRYEAALQVARVLATATSSPERFSKSNWRTITNLLQTLKTELVSLGVDVDAARLQAEKNIAAPVAVSKNQTKSLGLGIDRTSATPSTNKIGAANLQSSLLGSTGSLSSAGLKPSSDAVTERSTEFPITSRLRANAGLVTIDRGQDSTSTTLGSSTELAYDVSPWLTVRAQSAKRNLQDTPDKSPLLSAPLFAGVNSAKSTGGGVDLNLGSLRVSTGVERLSSEEGLLGTKVGGGIGISAFENRLSLSARLSKLVPEDRSTKESTATELNMGVGLSDRLSLNLLYQSLFTNQNSANKERVSGGLSLSF